MNKKNILKKLNNAMDIRENEKGENYKDRYFFSDTCDEGIKSIFLENYNINDTDYQIFYKAIHTISEALEDCGDTGVSEYIQDNYTEHASIMNWDRIRYIDNWSVYEISDIMKEYDTHEILQGCAIWYDVRVQEAIEKILAYLKL